MKTLRRLAVILPCIMLAPSALAQADALDLTVDIGSAQQKGDRFSGNDSSVGLTLGYELSTHWSLQLSYTDFGQAQMQNATLVSPERSYTVLRFIDSKALGLSAQYLSSPVLAGWSFGGRVGLMHVDASMSSAVPDYQDYWDFATKDATSALSLGVLASYNLMDRLNLILSADTMKPEIQTYGNGTEKVKTRRFAVGLNYHF